MVFIWVEAWNFVREWPLLQVTNLDSVPSCYKFSIYVYFSDQIGP